MKLTILPSWCKWLSLALFICAIIAALLFDMESMAEGYSKGYSSYGSTYSPAQAEIKSATEAEQGGLAALGDVLLFAAIVTYILSQDKDDDEYINLIRAKALLLALLIVTALVTVVYLLGSSIDGSLLLAIHFIAYITTFKIMKFRAYIKADVA